MIAAPDDPAACIIGSSSAKIWGERPNQRLQRMLAREEITRFINEDQIGTHEESVILVRGDCVLDATVVRALVRTKSIVVMSSDATPTPLAAHAAPEDVARAVQTIRQSKPETAEGEGKLRTVTTAELGAYQPALRKKEPPYALLVDPKNRRAVEWKMFLATYKGATDFVTKWIWPVPAFFATKLCARAKITPNQVTALSLVLVIAATYWFAQGNWLPGLIAGWVMTFLDTVDGKLARITLTSSRIGNAFDHGIDLIHPPIWYLAWGIGLQSVDPTTSLADLSLVLTIIVGAYIIQRAIEGLFILVFKMEIYIWRPFDTMFRLVTTRRNPNLVLLTLGVIIWDGKAGLYAVAVWSVISIIVHLFQFAQAIIATGQQRKIVSWLQD